MFMQATRLSNRRKSSRIPTSKTAFILLRNNAFRMPCTVVDISRHGARLRPEDTMLLPNEFSLQFEPNQSIPCEIVHRTGNEVGVRFL